MSSIGELNVSFTDKEKDTIHGKITGDIENMKKLIFDDKLKPGVVTRRRKKVGITQTCHVLQSIALVFYVLQDMYGHCSPPVPLETLGEKVNQVLRLIRTIIAKGNTREQIFEGQDGQSVEDFLHSRIPDKADETIEKLKTLKKIRNKLLNKRYKKINEAFETFWKLSFEAPLSIDIVDTEHDPDTTGGLYASIHSFTIYKGYIVTGWADDYFSVPLNIKKLNLAEFKHFVGFFSRDYDETEDYETEDYDREEKEFKKMFKEFFFKDAFSHSIKSGTGSSKDTEEIIERQTDKFWKSRGKYSFYYLMATGETEAVSLKSILKNISPLLNLPDYPCFKPKTRKSPAKSNKKTKRKHFTFRLLKKL